MELSFGLILLFVCLPASGFAECTQADNDASTRRALETQYATIERATFAKDAAALFSVYAPDFEAHNINGSVSKFRDSAAYVTAGFDPVKQNIHLSNTIVGMVSCATRQVKATVLQQWTRMQESSGELRRYETNTVRDETWTFDGTVWKRQLIDNIRPGAWFVDGKCVDPGKAYDPDAPEFDPHGLSPATVSSRSE